MAAGRLRRIHIVDNTLRLVHLRIDSYLAVWLVEFFRYCLLASQQSLTLETVSHIHQSWSFYSRLGLTVTGRISIMWQRTIGTSILTGSGHG